MAVMMMMMTMKQTVWLFHVQQCTPGFTRVPGGRYLGECVGCNCHGHSDECDESGQCLVRPSLLSSHTSNV